MGHNAVKTLSGLLRVALFRFGPLFQCQANAFSFRVYEAEVAPTQHPQKMPLELEEGAALVIAIVSHGYGIHGRQILGIAEIPHVSSTPATNETVTDCRDVHAE